MLKIQNSRCIKLPSTFYTVEYQIYTQYLQTILRTFQGTYIQDLYSGGIYVEGKMYQYLRMTTFYLFDLLLGGLYRGEAYFRGAYIQEFTVYGSAAYQELFWLIPGIQIVPKMIKIRRSSGIVAIFSKPIIVTEVMKSISRDDKA